MNKFAKNFLDFSYKSPVSFYGVKNSIVLLEEKGYKKLEEKDKWELKNKEKYYVTINDSSLFAFEIGDKKPSETSFRIVGSHTDSPGIRIKPNPEICENGFLKLNIEVYGGPILNTWLDRPLALAGRVFTKGENSFSPKVHLVNINKALMIIPNLAIHQNREVNKGIELNKQIDMLPTLAVVKEGLEKENYLLKLLAKEAKIKEEILDFELYLYEYEKGNFVGANQELLSASRIDNLASMYGSLVALTESKDFSGIKVLAAFDNEEIGSETRQGADSNNLAYLLERLVYGLGGTREEYLRALASSFMFSADGAHAIHPNKGSTTDPTNIPRVNGGVTIKYSANFKYTTDALSSSIIKDLANKNNIKYQIFVNRADMLGGSTIGPASSKYLPIPSIDLGIPMLSMHSIRELCGVEDLVSIKELIRVFYEA